VVRRAVAEALGTAFLLAAVVGSGIMGERLAGGNATGATLTALILTLGAVSGAPLFAASRHVRAGRAQLFSEFIATFGLLCVIWGCARLRSSAVPFAVGAYIVGAYWFTASTSFANPAVTLARAASDTFAGIRPADVPGFVAAQIAGATAATALFRWLVRQVPDLPSAAGAEPGSLRESRGSR
jgi:glycerol uptake facilitator-like aquaporin